MKTKIKVLERIKKTRKKVTGRRAFNRGKPMFKRGTIRRQISLPLDENLRLKMMVEIREVQNKYKEL